MEPPERPSRHRSHDKWKRIIEPAGDSDSSEWSSDSDMGIGMNSFRNYRHLESSLGNGSSSSSSNREQQSPANASGQGKQSREQPSSIFRTLESYGFMSDPAVGSKRFEGLDGSVGSSANHYNHLLHHDYAERDVNSERSVTSGPLWFHRPMYNSLINLGRKRQRLMNNPVSVIDCSTTANTPSTSSCGLTNATTLDDGAMQDPETGNAPTSNSGLNQEDEEGWRVLSSMGRLNSPSRKRSFFMPSDSTAAGSAEPSDANERGNAATSGCSGISAPGSSMQLQPQAGQHDSTITSAAMDAPHHPILPPEFFCPSEWYVQKKVQSRCNKLRFNDGTFRRLAGASGLLPEDCSRTVPRPCDDSSEIQVLSMAGPSNCTYPSGNRRLQLMGAEEPVLDDSLQNTRGIVETNDEGVEVIMVDDAQPESAAAPEKRSSNQPQEEQQQYSSAPSCKRFRDDDEMLNQGLIGLLECPVCMEYMGPPIHQCRRGHLVCSACKPKLPSCPTCRSRFTESRNLAMEKVADKLHYPCKNAHMGCTETLRLRNKDEHEANCAYRSYRCIMVPPCEWKGQHHEILPHVTLAHSDILLQGPEHVLEMRLGDLTEQSSQNWIVSALGELFRVNLGAVRGGRVQVFGCVLLLGPARRAPFFRYTLMVEYGPAEGDSTQRKMSYSHTTHCYVERCSVYYSAGDSFHLRTEAAQLFSSGPSNDRIMYVKLHIEKIDS